MKIFYLETAAKRRKKQKLEGRLTLSEALDMEREKLMKYLQDMRSSQDMRIDSEMSLFLLTNI